MALIKGKYDWREKYGATICENLYCNYEGCIDTIIPLRFELPTPFGVKTKYLKLYGNQLSIEVPLCESDKTGTDSLLFDHSQYRIWTGRIAPSKTDKVYINNLVTGCYIRFECNTNHKCEITEIVALPNGNIQFKTSQVSPYLKIREEGFQEDNYYYVLNETVSASHFVMAIENGSYTIYEGYYDNTNPFSTGTKIIDTLFIKVNGVTKGFNVYDINNTAHSDKNKLYRVKAPKGIGYIYCEEYTSANKKQPIFYLNGKKYVLLEMAPTTSTDPIGYEYVPLAVFDDEIFTITTDTNLSVPSGSYYWTESSRYTLVNKYPVPIYNIIFVAELEKYSNSTMSSWQANQTCYCRINTTSSWTSMGTTLGKGCIWFYTPENTPGYEHYWPNGLSNFSYFNCEPNSSSVSSSDYHWLIPTRGVYVQVQAKTVV